MSIKDYNDKSEDLEGCVNELEDYKIISYSDAEQFRRRIREMLIKE